MTVEVIHLLLEYRYELSLGICHKQPVVQWKLLMNRLLHLTTEKKGEDRYGEIWSSYAENMYNDA